jgi:hypothetical protein
MDSGGECGAGSRDRTHADHPFLLDPECVPADRYIGETPSRHARRPDPFPPVLPSTTAELRATGKTHRKIAKSHVRVEYGMTPFVDEELLEFLAPAGTSKNNAPEYIMLTPHPAAGSPQEQCTGIHGDAGTAQSAPVCWSGNNAVPHAPYCRRAGFCA